VTFKLSLIVAAAGLVIGSSAIAAPTGSAVPLSNYTSGTTDIYVAGSSAVDLALTKFIANTCVAGSLDTYRADAGGKTYYLWTCSTAAGSNFGLTSGNTKIAIHKNTNSSSDGVNAVANGAAALNYLQVADLTTAAACPVSPTVVAATPTIPQYNVFTCGATIGTNGTPPTTHVARFGFADSEPAQFASSGAVVTQLTTVYPLTIIFGVPVSKNVRDALQVAQGLTTGDRESEANMPTLTSAQINSIFTGNFSTWADLGVNVASDNNIYVVRRSNGSGTTRAFNDTFIGEFCTPGNPGVVTGTAIVTATLNTQCASGATTALQAGTSDDMAACVASFNTSGAGAIGYLSTDYLPGTSDGYRWIKVDGYAPKQLNVVNGTWKDWSEESLNYNTKTKLTGDDLAFYNTLKSTSASPTLLSEIGKNLPQTTSGEWTGGILGALPTGFNSWGIAAGASLTAGRTDASVLAYPANPATRAGSKGYNLCLFPQPTSGFQAQ